MSKIASSLHEPGVIPHGPNPEEIGRQLRAILASPVFHGSRRCQQFLEFVCEKSLAGEGSTIKERMIAVVVFGRPPQTDLGEDTIMRVGAREVRKRLARNYITPEGAAAEVRIELPFGFVHAGIPLCGRRAGGNCGATNAGSPPKVVE